MPLRRERHLTHFKSPCLKIQEYSPLINYVNKDVSFLKFLNVLLYLLELSLTTLFLLFQSVRVDVRVSDCLVFSMYNFPLLLQSVDQLLSLFFRKYELLLVDLLLFFVMKILNKLVFIIDFFLNLRQILWNRSVSLLFEIIWILVLRHFGSCEDVFNCILIIRMK